MQTETQVLAMPAGVVHDAPTVSVMMCVYNSERFLKEALESVLSQTFSDFELVAVDDGSTDSSFSILQDYARRDRRIRAVKGPHDGLIASRNGALAESRGKFIAVADSDDVSLPSRFETQLRFLEANPGFVAVGCSYGLIDVDGAPISRVRAETDPEKFKARLTRGLDGYGCLLMMRRKAMLNIGGHSYGSDGAEDIDIMLRLLEEGDVGNVPEVLVNYRQRSDSVCHSSVNFLQNLNMVLTRRGYSTVARPSMLMSLPRNEQVACRKFINHLRWSCRALKAGNFSTAAKHALKTVRTSIPVKFFFHLAGAAFTRALARWKRQPSIGR